MIAVHVRTERNASIVHLAKPIELAVKSELLQDAEDGDQKSETHHKPDEAAPVLDRPEGLRSQKEKKDIGKEEGDFHSRSVGRSGLMKQPLAESDDQQRDKRQKQRRNDDLMLLVEIRADGPGKEEQGCADLQDSARPILDGAVRRHAED